MAPKGSAGVGGDLQETEGNWKMQNFEGSLLWCFFFT